MSISLGLNHNFMSISWGLNHNFRRFSICFSTQDVCTLRLGNPSTIWSFKGHYRSSVFSRSLQGTLSRGVLLVRLNWLRISEQIAEASCINSLLPAAVWKDKTLFFIRCWKFKLHDNFRKGHRRMASSESSVSDMNWSCGGNAVATGHSGSNDDFQKDVCDIDACQGDGPSQREECLTRQIQMENSVSFTSSSFMATSSSAIHESEEVAQETESTQKIDPKSPLWKYVTTVGKIQGGGSLAWVCSECQKEFKGSYTRVKAHLLGLKNNGIRICSGPPKENGKDGNGLSKVKIAKYQREQEEADAKANEANPASHLKHPTRLGSSSKPPLYSYGVVGSKRSNLGPLEKSFNNDAREIVDAAVAQCIYANGLPFNLVRSPYWAKMVKCLNEAPRGYKSPGYEKIRTTLLSAQKLDLEAKLAPIRDSWLISGVSIISDGWKDQRNRPLINVIAQSPHGAMFLKAVDCEGQMKDSQFIADILIEAIELVGPENVVQVITDNATVCRAAGLIVEGKYQHIFWTPCAVHSLNLMLSKLGKQIEWIRKIFEEAKEIQAFITNHHMSQGIYREFAKLELLKVAETRFASHIIVLTRLMQVKDALQSMVCSSLWNQWRQSQSDRAQAMKRLVVDDEWWDKVEYLLAFTKSIVDLLRMFDTDMPNLGEVYEGIDSMIEKIKLVINAKENDPDEIFYGEVKDILTKRWNKMTTPLHLLAYALNPKYYAAELLRDPERSAPNKDPEVAEGFKNAFRKLFVDPEIGLRIRAQFSHFVGSEGWGCDIECMRDKSRLSPIEWWNFYGGALPHIQKLAIKVLSQVASSSSAERNWSTYGFIHSVKRNRLGSKKAEELVYIHSNLRLLSHKRDEYKFGPTKLWDVEPELPDLDMTLNAMSHMSLFDSEPSLGIGASSSGHGSNVHTHSATSSPREDVEVEHYSGMNKDIFDDM